MLKLFDRYVVNCEENVKTRSTLKEVKSTFLNFLSLVDVKSTFQQSMAGSLLPCGILPTQFLEESERGILREYSSPKKVR